ncbi:MAG: DUF1684 domain-containing protein [Actinomycetaceae bacterium]|nr:DUF1684 domain-containing protein [Actinomycetaceae bacterium]
MSDAVIKKWESWHAERNQALAAEHGWLTLVSFTWVGLDPELIPDFPGIWKGEEDGRLVAEFSDLGFVREAETGEPVVGQREWLLNNEESAFDLVTDTRLAEVAKRGGRYAVRVRDSQAPTRAEFTGVPIYDYNPRWALRGEYRAVEPYEVTRDTAMPGVQGTARIVGEVTLKNDDAGSVTLRVEEFSEGRRLIIFSDVSSGNQTAFWRNVAVMPVGDTAGMGDEAGVGAEVDAGDNGVVIVDFNFAANFPAAFSVYATCPKPVEGNFIPWPILAGERRP